MGNITIDFLRRDECQPLKQEQIADIKSQFHPADTANVNIMPYEIYDEDEHIVGEWCKTIDGVKKKKSVYERTFISNYTTSISWDQSDVEQILKLEAIMRDSDSRYLGWHTPGGASYLYNWAVMTESVNNLISWRVADSDYWNTNSVIIVTVRYAKLSDTWEKV